MSWPWIVAFVVVYLLVSAPVAVGCVPRYFVDDDPVDGLFWMGFVLLFWPLLAVPAVMIGFVVGLGWLARFLGRAFGALR